MAGSEWGPWGLGGTDLDQCWFRENSGDGSDLPAHLSSERSKLISRKAKVFAWFISWWLGFPLYMRSKWSEWLECAEYKKSEL